MLQENQFRLQKERQTLVNNIESHTSMHLSLISIVLIIMFIIIVITSIVYIYKCKRNSFITKMQKLLIINTEKSDDINSTPLVQIRS